jgi:hypothetical protein
MAPHLTLVGITHPLTLVVEYSIPSLDNQIHLTYPIHMRLYIQNIITSSSALKYK